MARIEIDINDTTGALRIMKINGTQATPRPGAHDTSEIRDIHLITVLETPNTHCILVAGVLYCW